MKVVIEISEEDVKEAAVKALVSNHGFKKHLQEAVHEAVAGKTSAIAGSLLSDPTLEDRMREQLNQAIGCSLDTIAKSYVGYKISTIVQDIDKGREYQIVSHAGVSSHSLCEHNLARFSCILCLQADVNSLRIESRNQRLIYSRVLHALQKKDIQAAIDALNARLDSEA